MEETKRLPETFTLESKRIIMRQPSTEDDETMRVILSDTTTMAYLLDMVPLGGWTEEGVKKRRENWIERHKNNTGFSLTVVDKASGSIIGSCGLSTIDFKHKHADIGIILHNTYWNKGYASECMQLVMTFGFETLALHRIHASTNFNNSPMRSFFENFGYSLEGTQKDYILSRGKWEDLVLYATFEDRWEETKKKMNAKTKILDI